MQKAFSSAVRLLRSMAEEERRNQKACRSPGEIDEDIAHGTRAARHENLDRLVERWHTDDEEKHRRKTRGHMRPVRTCSMMHEQAEHEIFGEMSALADDE